MKTRWEFTQRKDAWQLQVFDADTGRSILLLFDADRDTLTRLALDHMATITHTEEGIINDDLAAVFA